MSEPVQNAPQEPADPSEPVGTATPVQTEPVVTPKDNASKRSLEDSLADVDDETRQFRNTAVRPSRNYYFLLAHAVTPASIGSPLGFVTR